MAKKTPTRQNEDDHEVWIEYTRKVKPLQKGKKLPNETQSDPVQQVKVTQTDLPKIAKPLSPINPPKARELKNILIQSRLDLHGLTLDRAHTRVLEFIERSYRQEYRCVLIITGKGSSSSHEWWEDQGVLRQQVPRWLMEEPIRSKITTYTVARAEHGGAGALYVFIKKKKL